MAVVTFAFRASAAPELATTDSSGFLVPPVDGRRIKASTFSFAKWGWVGAAGGGLLLLRTSLGRYGEEVALQATDDELVAWSLADLREAVGLRADPVDTHVQRWGGGLPQYAVGHLDRVARIRASVDAGAGADGLRRRLRRCRHPGRHRVGAPRGARARLETGASAATEADSTRAGAAGVVHGVDVAVDRAAVAAQ